MAGENKDAKLKLGETIRVFTGARLPKNAQTVVMQENALEKNNYVTFLRTPKKNENRRLAGEDIKKKGIDKNKIYVKVVGYDEYGIWIDHPSFNVPQVKNGKHKGTKDVNASILIPWGFIASVVHFPGTEGFDFPFPFNKPIGFNIEEK